MKDIIIKNLPKHLSKITDCDFSKSKCVYSDEIMRYANKSMLFTRMKNGQLQKREWLMYSHSTGCFYCVPCTLFHNESINCDTAFTNGFNDWKNASRLLHHEKSAAHRNNTLSFVKRGNVHGRIDSALHQQYMKEVEYWRKVLSRVVHVIKFLGSRGLALRGSKNEKFGSVTNGNFMGILELVAEYDEFLKSHIKTHGNPGKGNVNYLSTTICNEFVEIMHKKIVSTIVEELKSSKYYYYQY